MSLVNLLFCVFLYVPLAVDYTGITSNEIKLSYEFLANTYANDYRLTIISLLEHVNNVHTCACGRTYVHTNIADKSNFKKPGV